MVKVLVPPICQERQKEVDFKTRDMNLCFMLSVEAKQLTRQPASWRVLGSAQGLPESDHQTMKEIFFLESVVMRQPAEPALNSVILQQLKSASQQLLCEYNNNNNDIQSTPFFLKLYL